MYIIEISRRRERLTEVFLFHKRVWLDLRLRRLELRRLELRPCRRVYGGLQYKIASSVHVVATLN